MVAVKYLNGAYGGEKNAHKMLDGEPTRHLEDTITWEYNTKHFLKS